VTVKYASSATKTFVFWTTLYSGKCHRMQAM